MTARSSYAIPRAKRGATRRPSTSLPEFVKSGAQTFESTCQHLRIASDADSNMFGHLEEPSGHHRGLVLLSKQRAQLIDPPSGHSRSDDCSERRSDRVEVVARIKKLIKQRAVSFKKRTRSSSDCIEIL